MATNTTHYTPSNIEIGTIVGIDGKEWVCSNLSTGLEHKLRFREVNGSGTNEITRDHLQELWEDERAEVVRCVKTATMIAKDLHNLTPREQRDYERKCAGVTIMLETEGDSRKKTMREFRRFCEKQNEQYLENHHIKPKSAQDIKTLQRWVREYRESGNFTCFIKKDHRTEYRARKYDEIEKIIEKVIINAYANERKPTVKRVYRTLIDKLRTELNISLISAEMIAPSYRTFLRRVHNSDYYKVLEKRLGRRLLKTKVGYGKRQSLPKYIGSRVEVDCNRVDVMVYDERLKRCYRPWLMIMIDVYSRCIIGWDLSTSAPSAAKVVRALKRSISSDDYPYRCIPATIVVDNGAEFVNASLRDQCATLGIRIEFAPPRTPKGKPVVERAFRTFNTDFFHNCGGTTFSNPEERGDYDSEGNAVYDLKKLNLRWEQYLPVYHTSYHRGIEDTPHNKWHGSACTPEYEPTTLPEKDAKFFGTKTTTATIQGGRVRFKNLFWSSGALPELAGRMAAKAGKQSGRGASKEVQLRYDESDLTHVWVNDPRDKEKNTITCDPDNPLYQTGLTMEVHEHLMTDSRAREHIVSGSASALELRIEFEKLIEEDAKKGRKTTRKRAQVLDAVKTSAQAHGMTVEDLPPKGIHLENTDSDIRQLDSDDDDYDNY